MEFDIKDTKPRLNPRHIQEITRRGLPLDWAQANCHSATALALPL